MIAAAAALFLGLALPVARAQTDIQAPGISYAACMDSRPVGLEAIVTFESPDQCDVHCRNSGYLYAFYAPDVTTDCGCRLYGPTAAEWRGSANPTLLCATGQWLVDITATTFQPPVCYGAVPALNQGSVEGGPSQDTPVSVVTRVSDHGACLRQCVNWNGANVSPDGDAYTCQCDDGAGGFPTTGTTNCTPDTITRFSHGRGAYTTAAPAGQSIWAKRSLRDQLRLDQQRVAGKLCPNTARACLTSPGSTTFECIETDDELESCGGCLYGEFGQAASLMTAAKDCSSIEGVTMGGVTCNGGRCIVSACEEGFKVDGDNCSTTGIPVHAGLYSFSE